VYDPSNPIAEEVVSKYLVKDIQPIEEEEHEDTSDTLRRYLQDDRFTSAVVYLNEQFKCFLKFKTYENSRSKTYYYFGELLREAVSNLPLPEKPYHAYYIAEQHFPLSFHDAMTIEERNGPNTVIMLANSLKMILSHIDVQEDVERNTRISY
jgi:hypothetical protein